MRILASLALVPGLVFAQTTAPTPAPTKVTSVEGITEYRLANGLQVLLFPDNSKPTVTVNVTYMVGSRHEGYGETGMAHLLEHMMFKGTTQARRDQGGAATPTARNSTAPPPRTAPITSRPSPPPTRTCSWALEMEADRMVNSRVSRQDLDSEMTVVRNEFESGENSPRRILEERVMSTAYLWHAYGRSPIGSRSDIEKVPIDRLQAFYRKYYQPDNAVLVVAGKVRRHQDSGLDQRYLRQNPQAHPQADAHLHRRAHPGRRARSGVAPRRRRRRNVMMAYPLARRRASR